MNGLPRGTPGGGDGDGGGGEGEGGEGEGGIGEGGDGEGGGGRGGRGGGGAGGEGKGGGGDGGGGGEGEAASHPSHLSVPRVSSTRAAVSVGTDTVIVIVPVAVVASGDMPGSVGALDADKNSSTAAAELRCASRREGVSRAAREGLGLGGERTFRQVRAVAGRGAARSLLHVWGSRGASHGPRRTASVAMFTSTSTALGMEGGNGGGHGGGGDGGGGDGGGEGGGGGLGGGVEGGGGGACGAPRGAAGG